MYKALNVIDLYMPIVHRMYDGGYHRMYAEGLLMLLLLHAIIPCLHTLHLCGSVNSELRTIYVVSLPLSCMRNFHVFF